MKKVTPFKKITDKFFLKKVITCDSYAVVNIADANNHNCIVTALSFEKDPQNGWSISSFSNIAFFDDSNVLADLIQRALLIISKGECHGF